VSFTEQERKIAYFLLLTFLVSAGIHLSRRYIPPDTSSTGITRKDSVFLHRVELVDSLVKHGGISTNPPPELRELVDSRTEFQLNINTADQAALETLPRVGPVLAKRIIAHREKNGYFKSFDDLQNVKGIGPATVLKLRPHIVFAQN